ncbi:hypothetical protein V5799_017542, partial [Amblyomma americanum]
QQDYLVCQGTKGANQTSHAEEPEIDNSGSSITKSLQSWAVSHHITQTAVTSLLKILASVFH